MNILVVGSGGREHAICTAFRRSPRTENLFCAPGNAGIADVGNCVNIAADDVMALAEFAATNDISLTFVGGEVSLALGIVDEFERRGLRIVGPKAKGARLESSKAFAKGFMASHGIPTAKFTVSHSTDFAILELESGDFGGLDSSVVVKLTASLRAKASSLQRDVPPQPRRSIHSVRSPVPRRLTRSFSKNALWAGKFRFLCLRMGKVLLLCRPFAIINA